MDDWLKGGTRYRKLKERVSDYLAPSRVQAFFVGIQRHSGRFQLFNPLVIFRPEYVIAVTTDKVLVLRLRRPAVYRASIAEIEHEEPRDIANVAWSGRDLIVGGANYRPIPFHRGDAEDVARHVSN